MPFDSKITDQDIKYLNESEDTKDFLYSLNAITKHNAPIYKVNELSELKYRHPKKFVNMNCHLGQRKLLLTEIEFFAKSIDDISGIPNVAIYAGSASCEHLPVIRKLYPNIKFLLIDANYHLIDDEYYYVYQNYQNVDKENLRHIVSKVLGAKNDLLHSKHLSKIANSLKKVSIYNKKDEYFDMLKSVEDRNKNKILNKQLTNVKNEFDNNGYKTLIEDLVKSDKNIFIIQDYLLLDLTKKISQSIRNYKGKVNIYFLTDIRTNNFVKVGPHDLDVIWNYALQIIFLKELRPKLSMLKFRPPFGNDVKSVVTEWFNKYYLTNDINHVPNKFRPISKIIYDDLKFVKSSYGIDLFDNYLNNKFYYFNCEDIYIQPWAPATSTESRMFVSHKKIDDKFVSYDVYEWENKFYYFSMYKNIVYIPQLYKNLSDVVPEYDGCYDCFRELMIIGMHLHKTANLNELEKLFTNKHTKESIKNIYELINTYTYFDLSKTNYKCLQHGYMRHANNNIIANIYSNDLSYLFGVSLSKDTKKININDVKYKYKMPDKFRIVNGKQLTQGISAFVLDNFVVDEKQYWYLLRHESKKN